MKKIFSAVAAVALTCAAVPTLAWDATPVGKIGSIDVTDGSNGGFRVYYQTTTGMCGAGPTWAYLNETDSNYKTYVSALLLAKAMQYYVTLYTYNLNGYCHIGYITVSNP